MVPLNAFTTTWFIKEATCEELKVCIKAGIEGLTTPVINLIAGHN
jgi:hypothetical protein